MGIVLLYMGLRFGFYWLAKETGAGWYLTDAVMNLPRGVCALLALWAGARYFGLREIFGGERGSWRSALAVGLPLGLLLVVHSWLRVAPYDLSPFWLGLVAVGSAFVALFEELLFRGVFLRGLDARFGRAAAVWVSAAVFTVYHVQAQPLWAWPGIFVFGAVAGLLVFSGVSLWWLIAIHFGGDTIIFLGNGGAWIHPAVNPVLVVVKLIFLALCYRKLAWRAAPATA